ncbi:hypothetical protein BC827DRAFT_189132 [Russula dissimulans]|nr:hypothetical protein BC827DRAFT_189132 [Russula dissimulans]
MKTQVPHLPHRHRIYTLHRLPLVGNPAYLSSPLLPSCLPSWTPQVTSLLAPSLRSSWFCAVIQLAIWLAVFLFLKWPCMLLVVIYRLQSSSSLRQFNHTSHTHHLSVLHSPLQLSALLPKLRSSITRDSTLRKSLSRPPLLIASSIIHKHSFLSFSLLDISVVYAAVLLIFPLRRTYVPFIFLLDIVIVFICVHLWCVLLRCSALVEVRSGGG